MWMMFVRWCSNVPAAFFSAHWPDGFARQNYISPLYNKKIRFVHANSDSPHTSKAEGAYKHFCFYHE